jgi:hypothetical protein
MTGEGHSRVSVGSSDFFKWSMQVAFARDDDVLSAGFLQRFGLLRRELFNRVTFLINK